MIDLIILISITPILLIISLYFHIKENPQNFKLYRMYKRGIWYKIKYQMYEKDSNNEYKLIDIITKNY